WVGLSGLYQRRDLPVVEAYLDDLAAHGVTILRLMLEYAHHDGWYFERAVGEPNSVMVQLWDDLILMCQARGLRILLTPWDTFWMARRWQHHPYNRVNGGPAASPGDFFTSPDVIKATINRLCLVIERWGETGVIAAWDLFNEIHPYWGGTPEQQSRVLAEISEQIREVEEQHWGFTRLQTVSCFGPNPDSEYAAMIFRHPSLDFATTHIYYKGSIDYPTETITPALTMRDWVRKGVQQASDRPFTDSEHGPIHLFNDHKRSLRPAFDDEYERRLMWAYLAAGGAGSGMRWPARNPHILTTGMKQALLSLSKFAGLIDWNTFRPSPLDYFPAANIHAIGSRDDRQAVLYVIHPSTSKYPTAYTPRPKIFSEIPIEIESLLPGVYHVSLWDVAASCLSHAQMITVASGEPLRLVLPSCRQDIAIAVQRV
ncbi:MAG: hypothetical protein K8I30_11155, partial [Anaerolineae bacterium]|nr:hypothetical protein [Anaerolineae bacterium]